MTRQLISEFVRRPDSDRPPPATLDVLTGREREVLTLVARGWSNAEIAERLYLSPATAKTHVGRLLTKLQARDRTQLVVIAYESGLVTPSGSWQALAPPGEAKPAELSLVLAWRAPRRRWRRRRLGPGGRSRCWRRRRSLRSCRLCFRRGSQGQGPAPPAGRRGAGVCAAVGAEGGAAGACAVGEGAGGGDGACATVEGRGRRRLRRLCDGRSGRHPVERRPEIGKEENDDQRGERRP